MILYYANHITSRLLIYINCNLLCVQNKETRMLDCVMAFRGVDNIALESRIESLAWNVPYWGNNKQLLLYEACLPIFQWYFHMCIYIVIMVNDFSRSGKHSRKRLPRTRENDRSTTCGIPGNCFKNAKEGFFFGSLYTRKMIEMMWGNDDISFEVRMMNHEISKRNDTTERGNKNLTLYIHIYDSY